MKRILIIEDDPDIIKLYTALTNEWSCIFSIYDKGFDALDDFILHNKSYCLVVTDLQLPDIKGVDLINSMQKTNPDVPIIVTTGDVSVDLPACIQLKLYKPFALNNLKRAIEYYCA